MKRRGFIGSMIAAAFAPKAVLALPVAGTPLASLAVASNVEPNCFLRGDGTWQPVGQYSVAYNLQAARQNEFGEAFFPTIVIPPHD